jgi:hypothetical protein
MRLQGEWVEMEKKDYGPFIFVAFSVFGLAAAFGVAFLVNYLRKDAAPPLSSGGNNAAPIAPNHADPNPWIAARAGPTVVVKAEDVKKLIGEMLSDTALDNEKEHDSSGNRARVVFVGVPDKACQKGHESDSKAIFELEISQDATYYPWARVWWSDSCGDSLAIRLRHRTDQKETSFVITDGTYEFWHWLPVAGSKGLPLKQGIYDIIVENREDGARLSRILFTTQDYETFMPTTPEG